MKSNDYCILLVVIVFFFIYMDNQNNIDGYDNFGAPLDGSVSDDLHETVGGGDGGGTGPIGQVPRKLNMDVPSSMVSSMEMLRSAPANMTNFMLLSADVEPGIQTIDSNVPVAYPRVGGYGNLGKDSTEHAADKPQELAGQGKSLKVVIIYAPWCGWSKKSLPDFEKMNSKLNSLSSSQTNGWDVSCELYDSETPDGKKKAKDYDVKGFPSVFVEIDGSRMEGPRDYDEMVELINNKIGSSIN